MNLLLSNYRSSGCCGFSDDLYKQDEMKLCGCVNWCRIGWLVVIINLLFIPNFTYSQNLPQALNVEVSDQQARVGSVSSHTILTDDVNSKSSKSFRLATTKATEATAAFSMSQSEGCDFLQVDFTDQSTDATSWEWDFGNGNTSTLKNPQTLYKSPGSYNVTLTINGGESTISDKVTIYANPTPGIADVTDPGCEPATVTLTSNGDAGVNYNWYFFEKHAAISSASTSVSANDFVSGSYNVRLEVTDSHGCKGSKTVMNLFEVNDKPDASFTYDKADICHPSLTTFTNTTAVSNSTISNSDWTVNGSLLSNHGESSSYNFTSAGSYTVGLTTTTAAGCVSNQYEKVIKFNPDNIASFSVNPTYCVGSTANLLASASDDAIAYAWDIYNDGSVESTSGSFSYNFTASGNYPIRLKVTFDDDCQIEVLKTVQVDETNASFNYVADYNCTNNNFPVVFTSTTSAFYNNTFSYKWFVNIGGTEQQVSTANSFTYTFNTPGDYSVRLVATNSNGCQSTSIQTISLVKPSVSINISGTTSGCALGASTPPTNFTASLNSAFETATSYSWNFGDTQTGTGANVNHTYVNAGVFSVSVEIISDRGCPYSGIQTDAIKLADQPVISALTLDQASNEYCYSADAGLEVQYSGSIDLLTFDTPSGTEEVNNPGSSPYNGFSYSFPGLGSYTINVTASLYGCASSSQSVTMQSKEPIASFEPSDTVLCSSFGVSFTNTSTYSPSHTSFSWDFGDGESSSSVSPSHTYAAVGDYTVSLTVFNDSTGCSDTFDKTISIYSFDSSVSGVITSNVNSGCAPLNVSFSKSNTDGISGNNTIAQYWWDFDANGTIDTITTFASAQHTYTQPENYTVRLTAVNNSGCHFQYTKPNMIQANGPWVNDLSTSPSLVCSGTNVTFSSDLTGGYNVASPLSYYWDLDETTSTDESPSHTYSGDGAFTISLSVTDANNCSASREVPDMIDIITFDPSFSLATTTLCLNTATVFTNTSTGDATQYQWDFGDGTPAVTTNTIGDVQHTYSTYGNFVVKLTAIAANGCSKPYSQNIEVINSTAEFRATDNQIGCAPEYAYFIPDADDNDVLSYSWDFGDGNTSDIRNPKNLYEIPGKYTVRLEIEFKGGCSMSFRQPNYITVDGAFGVLSYDTIPGCAPNAVSFSVSQMSRVNYIEWDFGTGELQTDTVPAGSTNTSTTYTYTDNRFYTPRVKLTDTVCGVSYIYDNKSLGRIYTSAVPVVNFSVDNDSICKGVALHFSDQTTTTDTVYPINKWRWNFDTSENDSANVKNPTFTYKYSGKFSPQLIVSNQLGCADTLKKANSIYIYGNYALKSDFDIDDPLACPAQQINFTSNADGGSNAITKYEWNFGSGYVEGNSTESHAFIDTLAGKSITVIHRVTDDKFCIDSTLRTVEINKLQAAIGYDPQPVYRGSLVDFSDQSTSDNGTNVTSWIWNFENGTPGSSTSQNPQDVSYATIQNGNKVNLTVTNDNNCTNSVQLLLDVLNNPPLIEPFTITLVENSSYSFRLNDFASHFNPNDPGQSFVSIRLESLPIFGTIRFNGSSYSSGTVIPISDINKLSYVPGSGWFGNENFTWNGYDGFSWANSAALIRINVVEQPDPPTLSNVVFNVPEDFVLQIQEQDFIDNINSVLGSSFVFTALDILSNISPSEGSLTYLGSEVNAPLSFSKAELENNDIAFEYSPLPGYNGTLTFNWNANDGYNYANSPAQVVINYYNTPPTLGDIIRTNLKEDTEQVISQNEFISQYSDQDKYDSPQSFYLTNLPPASQGVFTYKGQTISSNNFRIPWDDLATIRFSPAHGFEGTVQASWGVSDGTDISYALIEFTYVNTPPVVHNFNISSPEDVVLTFQVTDFESETIEFPFEDDDVWDKIQFIQINTLPGLGSLLYNGSSVSTPLIIDRANISKLTYVPDADWSGEDSLRYTASDGTDWSANDATVYITITPVNDAPRPQPDNYTIDEDETLTGVSVKTNDFDVDDNLSSLTYSVQPGDAGTAGENGIITLNPNGDLTYQPNKDFNGSVQFVYTVCDFAGACSQETVFININPVNDPPSANPDAFSLYEDDGSKSFNCLTNDFDIDGDNIQLNSVVSLQSATLDTDYGTLTWQPDGSITFTLNSGLDTLEAGEFINLNFEYVISDVLNVTETSNFVITIEGRNDPPTAVDDAFSIYEGTETTTINGIDYYSVLLNDTDPENDALAVSSVIESSYNLQFGSFTWTTDGNWTFTQNLGATDSLKQNQVLSLDYPYITKDQSSESLPANIELNIFGVNDAPIANNDYLNIFEDVTSISIAAADAQALLVNDTDVDHDRIQVYDVEGSRFTTKKSPVGTLQWDFDGSYTYIPNKDSVQQLAAGQSIIDVFNYTIIDNFGARAGAQLIITITGLNDAPFAQDDAIEIYEDTHITQVDSLNGLLANDGDVDHDPIVVAVNNIGTNTLTGKFGTLTWRTNGSFTYVTDTTIIDTLFYNESVIDVFTYTVKDIYGETDFASLNIIIKGQNDAPIARDHFEKMYENDSVLVITTRDKGILAEDSDIDDHLNFGIEQVNEKNNSPAEGTYGKLNWNYDGTFEYVLYPEMDTLYFNEVVTDSFKYVIQDIYDSTAYAFFYIEIIGNNDNPVAHNDTLKLTEDDITITPSWTLLYNDMDPDGDLIKMNSFSEIKTTPVQTKFAEFDWQNTGHFTYNRYVYTSSIKGLDTLAFDDVVYDSIPYSILDVYNEPSTAYLHLNIKGVNDSPVATRDLNLANETTVSITSTASKRLLANDYDVDRRDSIALLNVNGSLTDTTRTKYGTLIWKPDGSYTYFIDPNATDSLYYQELVLDLIPYSIIDKQGAVTTDTLEIKIYGFNDNPVAQNDTVTIFEDSLSVYINPDKQGLFANDYDVDGDPFEIQLSNSDSVQQIAGKYGTLTLSKTGEAFYTLNAETDTLFQGEKVVDKFNYIIADNHNARAKAILVVNINGQNDFPVALDNFVEINEDTDSIYSPVGNVNALLTNDSDIDGDILIVSNIDDTNRKTTQGNYGKLIWKKDGSYTYLTDKTISDTLAFGETGRELFTYVINDEFDGADTAQFKIDIIGMNDPPVAMKNAYVTFDVQPVIITTDSTNDILDNDYDVDSWVTTIIAVDNSPKDTINGKWGKLIWHSDGSFTYLPDSAKAIALRPNEVNTDQFEYKISDEWGATDTSLIDINITGINNAPTAHNDSLILFEDGVTAVPKNSLLFNDTDPDRDTLVMTQLENDLTGVMQGFYGEVFWNDKGEVVFTPKRTYIDQLGPGQIETETYTYTIVDEGGLNTTADLIVKIIGENDPIVAYNDSVTLEEDGHILVNVLANDIDPDNNYEGNLAKAPVQILTPTKHGSASVNTYNGSIYYLPDENYFGPDSLLYRVCDNEGSCDQAWVYFDVISVNDPPVASNIVLQTDMNIPVSFNAFSQVTDIDDGVNPASLNFPEGNLTLKDSILTYTPDSDFVGFDEFIYSLADSSGATAYVIVNVLIPDGGDGAQDDWVRTNENTPISVKVLENDTLNGFVPNPLSVDIKIFPVNGVASYDPYQQVILYQPNENYNGFDSLTYVVNSKTGLWDLATVHISVEPINSPIEANDDARTTLLNQTLTIPILQNDIDEDNGIDLNSIVILQGTSNGTATYNSATGNVTYKPNTDYKGPDYFTYRVCDLDQESPSCDSASVFILVKSKFDDLQAGNDSVSTFENTPVNIAYNDLIANDVVKEGMIDFNSFTILSIPQHGTFEWNTTTNDIVYTPASNYFGPDWMTYRLCDTTGSCDMAEINIWVEETNSAPVTGDDYYVVTENTTKRLYILSNDFDYDGTLNWNSLSAVTSPASGDITIDKNTGTILYTPSVNANTDEFIYKICDNNGDCSEGTIHITIDLGSTILYNQITYEDTPDTIDLAPLLATFNFKETIDTYTEIVAPVIGSWEFINNNTQLVYTPMHDSTGSDYYNFILYFPSLDTADLKVSVTIIPVNDTPVALLDTLVWPTGKDSLTISYNDLLWNDYDVDGDSILLTKQAVDFGDSLHIVFNADSTITISADTIFWCDSWFNYEIADPSGASAIGRAFIMPELEGIVANKDIVSVDENSTANVIDVLLNDIIKDNQRCTIDTIVITQSPVNGIAASINENSILYQPTVTYYGPDSLFYTITDIWGQTAGAWVIINVIERNTPPVAVSDEITNEFGQELIINILNNDYDPDPDGWIDTIQTYLNIAQQPQTGTVWFNADAGYFVYKPFDLSCEGDEFSYTIFDNEGDSATATVSISLPAVAPLFAVTDTVKTYPGVPIGFNVLSNDGGYFIPYIENYTQPMAGTVEQTGDSTFIFNPGADFIGNDSMTYQLISPCGNTTTGYVIFMIEELRVPEIITPNNDGKNDVLIIDGIEYFPDSWLQIYNRYGHVVYQRKGYENDWGGYSNQGSLGGNKPLPSGTYYYTLSYNEGRNKQAGIIYIYR